MATIIAENDDGIQAKITTAVKNNASEIELNADQIKLSGSTLATRIEATEGTIGGVTIANNDIHSSNNKFKVDKDGNLTATAANITGAITATSGSFTGSITSKSGAIGGIKIADGYIHSDNNKFKVASDGKLTATDATITGAITATSLSLSGTKI